MRGWLLDTDVVSEMARRRPDPRVIAWLAQTPEERTFISIIVLAEVDQGIEALPPDDDRRERYRRFRDRLEAQFTGRVLPLDDETVRLWGVLSGRFRQAFGGKAPVVDTLLVATAERRRLHLATRNVRDARRLGASAFDPWTDLATDFPLQA